MTDQTPMTEAGRKVVAMHGSSLLDDVLGIEAEAADAYPGLEAIIAEAAQPAPLDEERLRVRIGAVVDRWYHLGLIRFNSRDDGGDDLILRDELVRAALDALEDSPKGSDARARELPGLGGERD